MDNTIYPITTGDYQFYQLGSTLFNDMMQDIKNAKHEILVEFFIIKNDDFSNKLLDLLQEKAREGIIVRILLDRVGGFRFTYKKRSILKKAGIHFAFSEKPGFPYLFYRLNRRNHRKITVMDGKIAYVGGFNIGDEYLGKKVKFSNWRDYHLRLTGQITQDIQALFQKDWERAKDKITVYHADLSPKSKEVQSIATDGFGLEEIFIQFINSAEKEILIGSPYFIPTKSLLHALHRAIERGVSVKLLVPMKADHPFVKEGGIPFLFKMKEYGAEVKLFDQGFYHGKLFLLDHKICDIGTANFDYRSFYWNKEINIILYDKSFIEEVRTAYLKDFQESIDVNEQWYNQLNWWTKMKMGIARVLRPFL